MKTQLLLFILLIGTSGCYAQNNEKSKNIPAVDLSFITNQKTAYAIVMMACRTCAPISNLGYRVVLKLSSEEQNKVKHINPETWLKLLNNDSTDFSANIVLYSLYSKDAFMLSRNNSAALWHKYLRRADVAFWDKKLKQPKPTH